MNDSLEGAKEEASSLSKLPEPPPLGCHFIIVPEGSDLAPENYSVSSIEELQTHLYDALERVECGWCWVFVNGKQCKLHMPHQVFALELPDGVVVFLQPAGKEPVTVDGRFYTLQPVKHSSLEA